MYRVVAGEEGREGGQVGAEALNVGDGNVAEHLVLVARADRVGERAWRRRVLLQVGRVRDVDELLVLADQVQHLPRKSAIPTRTQMGGKALFSVSSRETRGKRAARRARPYRARARR